MADNILTVILITYNHVQTIKKALDSILEQKTNFGFQIWVLDDASTDGTSDIVKEYSEKYPSVIIPKIRTVNTSCKHIIDELPNITSKYYAMLEADDYWCDDTKLQTQIDILEQNQDCSFCAHNTLKYYSANDISKPYIKNAKTGKYSFPKHKLGGKEYIEPHFSSRVYRTECLDFSDIKNKIVSVYDLASNFHFLTKGNLYYIDKIMSVYNYSQKGLYSGADEYKKLYMTANIIYLLNDNYNYKYNNLLSKSFSSRLRLNLYDYIKLRYLTPKKNLKTVYQNILRKFEQDNLKPIDTKILALWKIKIPHNKKILFEIKREKEIV